MANRVFSPIPPGWERCPEIGMIAPDYPLIPMKVWSSCCCSRLLDRKLTGHQQAQAEETIVTLVMQQDHYGEHIDA